MGDEVRELSENSCCLGNVHHVLHVRWQYCTSAHRNDEPESIWTTSTEHHHTASDSDHWPALLVYHERCTTFVAVTELITVNWLSCDTGPDATEMYIICMTLCESFSSELMKPLPSLLWHCWLGGRKGIQPVKNGGWGRWALASPDGVALSRMVSVSASVNLPLHIKSRSSRLAPAHPGGSGKGP